MIALTTLNNALTPANETLKTLLPYLAQANSNVDQDRAAIDATNKAYK
jgi:hypothetical protein